MYNNTIRVFYFWRRAGISEQHGNDTTVLLVRRYWSNILVWSASLKAYLGAISKKEMFRFKALIRLVGWLGLLRSIFLYTRASKTGNYCLKTILSGYEHPFQNRDSNQWTLILQSSALPFRTPFDFGAIPILSSF